MSKLARLPDLTSDAVGKDHRRPPLKRKALMLAYHFPPISSVGAFRSLRFAKYLPQFGWKPLVISLLPEYSGETIDQSLVADLPAEGVYCRTSQLQWEDRLNRWARPLVRSGETRQSANFQEALSRESRLKRFLRNLRDYAFRTPDPQIAWKSQALRAARQFILKYRPEVLYSTGPPHSTHLIAARLKQEFPIPWVADFRDPWARTPWAAELFQDNPWGLRLLSRYERKCVVAADAVILNTQRLREEFLEFYPDQPSKKFHAIHNGYDPGWLPTAQDLVAQAAVNSFPGAIRICHVGSLYGRRDLRPLLAAIKSLAKQGEPLRFEQIGHVDKAAELNQFIEQHELSKLVGIQEHVVHSTALRHIASADILLILQPGTELQVPAKLYEALMFQKPLLGLTGSGATADIIREFGIGAVADPASKSAIARAIKRLIEAQPPATAWRAARERFNGKKLTGDLAQLFSGIAQREPVANRKPESLE